MQFSDPLLMTEDKIDWDHREETKIIKKPKRKIKTVFIVGRLVY